jgi:hypothetical protein
MSYQMQKRRKDSNFLTPEELDVQEALKVYKTVDHGADYFDWVSSDQLYETYRAYFNSRLHQPDDPELLKIREFGAALRRVFPEFEDDDERRVKVTINGKRRWGFTGINGPGSVRINPQRGRPKGTHKAAPAPAKVQRRYEVPPVVDEDFYEDPCR